MGELPRQIDWNRCVSRFRCLDRVLHLYNYYSEAISEHPVFLPIASIIHHTMLVYILIFHPLPMNAKVANAFRCLPSHASIQSFSMFPLTYPCSTSSFPARMEIQWDPYTSVPRPTPQSSLCSNNSATSHPLPYASHQEQYAPSPVYIRLL